MIKTDILVITWIKFGIDSWLNQLINLCVMTISPHKKGISLDYKSNNNNNNFLLVQLNNKNLQISEELFYL